MNEGLDILPIPAGSTEWQKDSNCLDQDPELFFPPHGAAGIAQTQEAINVCRACPVQSQCLEWALEVGINHGILGAKSEAERSGMRRRMSRTVARASFVTE